MQEDSLRIFLRFIFVLLLLLGIGALIGHYVFKKFPSAVVAQSRTIPVHEEIKKPSVKSIPPLNLGTDVYGYPLETADKVQLTGLLRSGKYKELTDQMQAYQKEFETNFRNEMKVGDAFKGFAIIDPSLAPRFDAWLQANPESYAPYLARAEYFATQAWESRGGKWASETSPEQFAEMERFFRLAEQDIAKAMSLHSNLLEAYAMQIDIARARGNELHADRLAKEALDRMPESFWLRSSYMMSLLPRWGGSYSAMEGFAEESEKLTSVNPRMKLLRGFIAWDKGRYLLREKKYEDALVEFDSALQYGEYWRFLVERASARSGMKQYSEALADLNRAVQLRPQIVDVLLERAEIFSRTNRIQEAAQDFELVAKLDPGSSELKQTRKWAAQTLVAAAYDLHKKKKTQESLTGFQGALELNPTHRDAYYFRAISYAENGRLDLARQDLEKSIQLDPRHYDSYVAIDWVLFKNKDLDTILSFWNRYLELEPDNAKAYLERSGTYYHKRDFQAASRDAKKACDLGNQEGCQRYKQVSQRN